MYNLEYLHGLSSVVKTILIFFSTSILFFISICLLIGHKTCIASTNIYKVEPQQNKVLSSNYPNSNNNSPNYSTIILSIGEQQEIEIKELNKFSINNSEIVKAKYLQKNHLLMIKGKKVGHTQISILTKSATKQIKIFVLPKKEGLKLAEVVATLQTIKSPISITEAGNSLILSGSINNINDYNTIKKLESVFTNNIRVNLHTTNILRNLIIGDIYYFLFQEYVNDINCFAQNLNFYCTYDKNTPPSEKLILHLEKQYQVKFIPLNTNPPFQNYLLKLKLVQFEKLDGEEFSLGINRLSGQLNDFFYSAIDKIILKNEVLLENQKIKVSTLAEPQIILKAASKTLIQMGSDVPYEVKKSVHTSTVEWHFVGLKINLEIKEHGEEYELEYSTEFSQSSNERIDGSKESSTLQLKLDQAIQLFEIGIRSNGKREVSLPGVNKIPLFGELFKATSDQKNYKKIYGIVLLQKCNNLSEKFTDINFEKERMIQ